MEKGSPNILFVMCHNLASNHANFTCWNPQDLLLMMGTEIFKIYAS